MRKLFDYVINSFAILLLWLRYKTYSMMIQNTYKKHCLAEITRRKKEQKLLKCMKYYAVP